MAPSHAQRVLPWQSHSGAWSAGEMNSSWADHAVGLSAAIASAERSGWVLRGCETGGCGRATKSRIALHRFTPSTVIPA